MAPAHESETIVFNFRKLLSTLPNYAELEQILLFSVNWGKQVWWSKKNGPAFQLFLKYIIKQMPWVFKTPCVINYNKVIQKRTFWLCNLWNFIWKSKGLFQFQLKTRTCLKHFKNELNFCKEFGSEDKLYCGTYCYNSCNTFSRSESGAETRSQTFQFLIDILNQNQDVEQVSTDI